jgi:hypothetical protein
VSGSTGFGAFAPKENVRPPALREKVDFVCGIGGIGRGFCERGKEVSSGVCASVEEGRVDEELNRADDEELS